MNCNQEFKISEIENLATGIEAVCAVLQHGCTAEACSGMDVLSLHVKGGLITAAGAMANEIQKKVDCEETGNVSSVDAYVKSEAS